MPDPLVTESYDMRGAGPNALVEKTPTNLPIPVREQEIKANPELEYVSGGYLFYWANQMYRTLPYYVDDITRDFGDDIYERMMVDPQVASCIHLLKMATLLRGVSLTPRVDDEKDPAYAACVEYTAFCQRAIDRLRGFTTTTLYDLLDALPFGNRLAEITYELATRGPDKGKLVYKSVKVKHRRTYAYVVDARMNVLGVLALVPGISPVTMGGTLLTDVSKLKNMLPRQKFVIFSFRPKNEDPRGQSICRPAYNPWWLKMQTWPEYLKYITQFASPSIWATTAENAQDTAARDNKGVLVKNDDGTQKYVSPSQAMLDTLIQFKNGSASVFPFGAALHPMEMQGDGAAFLSAIDMFDRQITKAILCQTLATEEGKYQARSASETHQDVLGMVINYIKECLEEVIEGDMLQPLVRLNFGDEAVEFTPRATLGDTDQQDFAAMAAAISALESSGYLAPSQRRGTDAVLGLTVRTAAEAEMVPPGVQRSAGSARPLEKATLKGG